MNSNVVQIITAVTAFCAPLWAVIGTLLGVAIANYLESRREERRWRRDHGAQQLDRIVKALHVTLHEAATLATGGKFDITSNHWVELRSAANQLGDAKLMKMTTSLCESVLTTNPDKDRVISLCAIIEARAEQLAHEWF